MLEYIQIVILVSVMVIAGLGLTLGRLHEAILLIGASLGVAQQTSSLTGGKGQEGWLVEDRNGNSQTDMQDAFERPDARVSHETR